MPRKINQIIDELLAANKLLNNYNIQPAQMHNGNGGTAPGYHITGLLNIKKAIDILIDLGLLVKLTGNISNSELYSTDDAINILASQAKVLLDDIDNIKTLTKELIIFFNDFILDEDPNSINIKLPPNTENLDDLSKVCRELHLGISQIILNDQINGEEQIRSVENGSIWLNIFLGTTVGASLIAGVVWSAAVAMKKIQEVRLFRLQVKNYKIETIKNDELLKITKKQIDMVIEAEANYLASEHFKDNPEEYIEKLKNSIRTFAELLDKGTEIHPAITAPENVSNLFPSMKNLLGVDSKVKQLGAGDN